MIDKTVCDPPLEHAQREVSPVRSVIRRIQQILRSNVSIATGGRATRVQTVTDWVISVMLVSYAIFAPHSIAITQGSYLVGLVAWSVQLATTRSFKPLRTPVDIALFGFFACCVVSSFYSYDPLVSLKGLRSPAFFLAFYFVSTKVRSIRFANFLAVTLVLSCLVNVAYSASKLAYGRGLRIDAINPTSAFASDTIQIGDVILEADDQTVNTPEALSQIVDSHRGRLRLKLQRKDSVIETSIPRRSVKEANGVGFERLGIATSPGRNFRISGFYSHYETYAEVLQLIVSLAVGLLIAAPRRRHLLTWFLCGSIALLVPTLILTSTRAAVAGLTISIAVMALASSRRRVLIVSIVGVLVILPVAFVAVEHSRGVSFFDPEEGSTAYRLEVWREALGIIKDNPLLGIGKGSEGKLKTSLGLYDEGRLPPGHFHSTPVQIAVWWGLLALILYFSFMTIWTIETSRTIRRLSSETLWQSRGIAIGGLGAVAAFNVSSLAHFNFGDGEVVMVLWLLTGLAFAVRRIAIETSGNGQPAHMPAPSSAGSSRRNQPQAQAAISEPSARAARAKQN